MQRLLTVFVLAAVAAAVSRPAFADNQEVADKIANNLRDSGKLSNYKIEVKYQQGIARLKGQVQNQAQMNAALRLAIQTDGVSRVVNELALVSPETASPEQAVQPPISSGQPTNPEPQFREEAAPGQVRSRPTTAVAWLKNVVAGSNRQEKSQASTQPAPRRTPGRAQRVPSSFSPAPARQAAAMQPVVVAQPAVMAEPVAESRTMPYVMIQQPTGRPIPIAYTQANGAMGGAEMAGGQAPGGPIPAYVAGTGGGVAPARYDQPNLPNYSWPSYASYPNYAGLTYPRQYSPTAWPYIGPFYPYPQVPLGWRKVTLEWDDGWWMLDFQDSPSCNWR